jgi:hypothetical protein
LRAHAVSATAAATMIPTMVAVGLDMGGRAVAGLL